MRVEAKQAHRRLALFIGLFLAVHFAAHFSAVGSIAAQDLVLRWGRAVYRVPVIEAALVLALAVQVVLGIGLLRRITKRSRKDFWHWVQFASGCYLVYFIVMHTSAALITRLAFGLDTNFYWAAGTLVLDPLRYGFAPYYVLAVMAITGHLLAALHFRKARRWHKPALALGPLAGVAIVLAYGGAFYAIELPAEHHVYFEYYPGVS
ncbi:membrane protein, putative [Erythrobacter sp. NAP1]|uniref:hypothetical protein n=1 Tax=Erythrobacter sp. NAP1 TaxID=237727 RepID=UPI0000686B8D|nr:hypothetical protein [Erythrobacter sp. NAP1]EAQ30735.1 membrane protein, putative [Erythrobacter sp. NAP1]